MPSNAMLGKAMTRAGCAHVEVDWMRRMLPQLGRRDSLGYPTPHGVQDMRGCVHEGNSSRSFCTQWIGLTHNSGFDFGGQLWPRV